VEVVVKGFAMHNLSYGQLSFHLPRREASAGKERSRAKRITEK
jgi:hypothetical protein